MTRQKNNKEQKVTKKEPKKATGLSSKRGEDFNTGSHSPSSVRKVGAGYDDTGKGNNSTGGKKRTIEKHK